MDAKEQETGVCCGRPAESSPCTCGFGTDAEKLNEPPATAGAACCGSSVVDPESDPFERPGYDRCGFVEDFVDTPVGTVPRVKTSLDRSDFLGTLKARLGIGRDNYKISPGLYCIGNPGPDAPVLVSANYKLTFDTLRRELDGIHAWVLILDTRGVNVWCAAGKKTFSTAEMVRRVKLTGLERLVRHRDLILPQLSATGVAAHLVRKGCGFRVLWGPVHAKDIRAFLDSGMKADEAMRRVSFSLAERMVLVPVEVSHLPKYLLWALLAGFVLSGIGADFFSFHAAGVRGLMIAAACITGIFAGAVVTPILLPWIPGIRFSLKGALTGVLAGAALVGWLWSKTTGWEALALFLLTVAMSSYLAMNFTGATPFTSPSGVEKEMRRAIPLQAGALLISLIAWIGSAFSL